MGLAEALNQRLRAHDNKGLLNEGALGSCSTIFHYLDCYEYK